MAGAIAQLLVASNDAGGGDGGGKHVRQLRKHLKAFAHPREGLSKSRRLPAIEAVVRAARRDLESNTAKACKRQVVPFNASQSAFRHLWYGDIGTEGAITRGGEGLAGMPLLLSNCSETHSRAAFVSRSDPQARGRRGRVLCPRSQDIRADGHRFGVPPRDQKRGRRRQGASRRASPARSRVHFAQPSLTPKSSLLRRRTSAPSSSMRKR